MECPARRKAEERRKASVDCDCNPAQASVSVCGLRGVALSVFARASHIPLLNDPQVETSVKTSEKHHTEILWIAREDQPLDPRDEARPNARFVWRSFVAFESQMVRYSALTGFRLTASRPVVNN